jgi:Tfp pilus assembly protein PilF
LDKVLKEFPKDHEAYLLRAINYYELGDTLRAFNDINAAIASKP